jgi:HSP20 family protein
MKEVKQKATSKTTASTAEPADTRTNAINANSKTPRMADTDRLMERMAEIVNETAIKAFDFFNERGGAEGYDLDNWLMAEKELLRPVPVEIRENDDTLFVTAAVPGFRPEDIEVGISDDQLILSGETETDDEKRKGDLISREWTSNRFYHRMTLPAAVDDENAKITLKNGMLELTLPKATAQAAGKTVAASA